MSKKSGTVLVAISATAFGSLAIFAKLAFAAQVNSTTMLTIRFTMAALLFWLLVLFTRTSARMTPKTMVTLFLLGACIYSSQSALYFAALALIPANTASLLLYTYPAMVFLAGLFLGTERISWSKSIALIFALCGLGLVLGASFSVLNLHGALFSLAAAAVYSVYTLVGNRVLRDVPSLPASAMVCTATAIVMLVWGLAGGRLTLEISLQGWLAIAGIVVFSTLIAILAYFAGLSRVGATKAAIISTLEPAVTVVLSYLVFGERMGPVQFLGGLLILAGIIVLQTEKEA